VASSSSQNTPAKKGRTKRSTAAADRPQRPSSSAVVRSADASSRRTDTEAICALRAARRSLSSGEPIGARRVASM